MDGRRIVQRFMDEGSHMLLDMEDGYSGAVWAMNPMEINWKYEDIILG